MTDLHLMTDEQLGLEIGSLIRDRVESAGPPAGVYLAIQDRLGSQGFDWSLSRLIGRLLPSEWRVPMFTGMIMKVTAAIVIAIAIVAVVVFQGGDEERGEVVPAVEPTATAVPQVEPTATSAPLPTATLVPAQATATPEPTATATPEPTVIVITDPVRNPPDITVLTVRTLPSELDPDQATEQPSEERVIELWTEYLTDTLLPIDLFYPNIGDLHFCGDGSIVSPTGQDEINLALEEPDNWFVSRNAGMSSSTWWEAILNVRFEKVSDSPAEKLSILTFKIENGEIVASFQGGTTSVPVYESEYCESLGG